MTKYIINNKSLFLTNNNTKKTINVLNNNIIEININACSFSEFFKNYKELDKFDIPAKTYFFADFPLNKEMQKQSIYIIKRDNLKIFITISGYQFRILQCETKEKNIIETVINEEQNNYKVTKYIYDLNHNIKKIKQYPKNNNLSSMFNLEKKEVLNLVRSLLNNLDKIENIGDILYPSVVYDVFNIRDSEYYNSVIEDDILFLSTDEKTELQNFRFSIVLKETKEIVGSINFDYENLEFSYLGNVSYNIKPEYQKNGYATRALFLLKQFLLKNKYVKDINLYISTKLENIASQKVIENNNGKLIYEGEVPKSETINYIDEVKKVKVYRIDIKK